MLVYEGQPDGYLNLYRIQASSDPNPKVYEDNSIRLVANLMTLTFVAYLSLML